VDEHQSHPRRPRADAALKFDRVWHELRDGPTILRSVSLTIAPGERVALMGRNGAGKSTLLRHAAGLMEPTRGRVIRGGRIALLLQNPNDYLIHERVAEEAPAAALRAVGLEALSDRHPRDLSGGERQRLALAIVLGDPAVDERPAAICLDEPTRGMDRDRKRGLAALLRALPAAILVATHDPEFAAAFADRVVLLADGAPIADVHHRDHPTSRYSDGNGVSLGFTAHYASGEIRPQADEIVEAAWYSRGGDLPRLPGKLSIARRLIDEHLLSHSEFWSTVPPSSVSLSEPSFRPGEARHLGLRRYWRGPTWLNAAWLLWLGLSRLGYGDQAAELAERTARAVAREGLREYYNPHTGQGLGAREFAWSTLVMELIDPDPRALDSYL